jgi:hypothetical protein
MAILKTATVTEAKHALEVGSFVYNCPCSTCGKECSTPTKDIWLRRIREFGTIEQMYAEYVCRNCRKAKVEPLRSAAPDPVRMQAPDAMRMQTPDPLHHQCVSKPVLHAPPVQKQQPMPGDAVKGPPGSIGISTWETNAAGALVYSGTQWHAVYKKD